MEMDFVGTFELEYGWMVDFSRIIGRFIILISLIDAQTRKWSTTS